MKKPSRKKIKRATLKFARLAGIPVATSRLSFQNTINWCNIDRILKAKSVWPVSVPDLSDGTVGPDGTVTMDIRFEFNVPVEEPIAYNQQQDQVQE